MLHYPVLLAQSIKLLNVKPDGVYIDGTFGRGGHSREILAKLSLNGRLIAFDKDVEAINFGKQSVADSRLTLIHDSFATMGLYLERMGIETVDGVLLDLGVSSPQVDTPERGFSFRFATELDMRMDNTRGQSAKEWISTVSEADLTDVLWRFGEEKFSRRIARNIIQARELGEISTTTKLADIIKHSVPFSEKGQHPATRCFQAIRIFINNELGDLEQFLTELPDWLNSNGRAVIISFHSLEDRLVKTRFNQLSTRESLPKWVTKEADMPEFTVIAKKIRAGLNEIEENNRSRSAVLRCLEKM